MGKTLWPGHSIENVTQGWTKVSNYETEILDSIDVNINDFGHWGSDVERDDDKYSVLYPIPNPWSSAYLFNYLISNSEIQLNDEVIKLIISVIYEYSVEKKFTCEFLRSYDCSDSFKVFFDAAPDFLKFGERKDTLIFLKNNQNKIIGGLSKGSLLWVSQSYRTDRYEIAKSSQNFCSYLRYVKEQLKSYPSSQEKFNDFWNHKLVDDLVKNGNLTDIEKHFEDKPIEFLIKIKEFLTSKSILLNSLKTQFELNIPDKEIISRSISFFIDKEVTKKFVENGFTLPINDNLLKDYLENKIHFAIKPLNSNKVDVTLFVENNRKSQLIDYVQDNRRIAIWPPYKPSVFNYVFVFETSFTETDYLVFYDENANKIDVKDITVLEGHATRIYRLKEFPKFIKLIKDSAFGFLITKPTEPKLTNKKAILSVDFGTTKTTLFAYDVTEKKEIELDYNLSKPIFISDEIGLGIMGLILPPLNFKYFSSKKPAIGSDPNRFVPFLPFISVYKKTKEINQQSNFMDILIYGNSLIDPSKIKLDTKFDDLYADLKWNGEQSKERDLYLSQILIMTMFELELRGFKQIEVRWAYPQSFSQTEKNLLNDFFKNFFNNLSSNN